MVQGPAAANLLALSQIPVPGFTQIQGPSPTDLPGSRTSPINRELASGASVTYFRSTGFTFSNGYLELVDSVWLLRSAGAAATAFQSVVSQADVKNTTTLSTGPLGSLSWAGVRTAPTSAGIPAVQFTVVWETDNCVNQLVARGRDGGVTLAMVLPLAKAISAKEVKHTKT